MREKTRLARILELITLAITLASASANFMGQQQPPAVTHPSASSVQVSPRAAPSPYGRAPSPSVGVQRAQGAITGFVYWQMNVLQPSSNCQGLTVKVVTVTKSGMPLQLLSTTSSLTAAGPMTDTSAAGTPQYMLCSYAFQNMPENVALRALLYGPSSTSISIPPSFQIPGGNCNSTPSSSLSFILTGGEMLCGNNAFNINFKLTSNAMARPAVTAPLLNGSGKPAGLLSPSGSTPNAATPATVPKTTGGSLLQGQTNSTGLIASGTQTGLLTSAQPGGNGNSGRSVGGSGGYTGPTKSSDSAAAFTGGVKSAASSGSNSQYQSGGSQAAISASGTWPQWSLTTPGNFVPKMPPLSSNAKRDAAQPADAAARSQIESKVKAQIVTTRQKTGQPAKGAITSAQSNIPEVQALQQQMTFVNSMRTQGALTNGTLLTAKAPSQVRIQPPAASNPLLHAPAPTKFCSAPAIHAVNGKTSGVIFTQDPAFNDYIITGCGFGPQAGQTYLSGAVTGGRINLVVKPGQWSDTQIEAVVQPGLTGVLDGWPDLIVVPNGSPSIKFPSNRFYAQRQSVLLPNIPQQYANLANVPVGDGTQGSGTMYCPGPDLMKFFPCVAFNAGYKIDGFTNGVDHRNDTSSYPVSNAVDRNGDQHQFDPGEDSYDLSYMAPGFEIDTAETFWYDWVYDVCEGWASDAFPKKLGDSVGADVQGYYSTSVKTKTKIVVDWAVPHCGWRWLGVFRVDDWYNSGYSLQVYVKGPIGVDPWTGHPVTTARNFGQAQPNRVVPVP